MTERPQQTVDAEALNDRLAREYSIDDYYERSAWFIRLVEGRRLSIIRDFVGPHEGLDIAEVGSGGGHVLRMFPRARLTAIDHTLGSASDQLHVLIGQLDDYEVVSL